MGKFRDWLEQSSRESAVNESSTQKTEDINEAVNVDELNASGIGYIINKTLATAAQVHIWHLLAKSGQKHSALGSFYDALETEIDGLAEKFLAIGGVIGSFECKFEAQYDDANIILAIREFREDVSGAIMFVKDSADLQSMLDGLTDLQEEIDQFIYRFKLD